MWILRIIVYFCTHTKYSKVRLETEGSINGCDEHSNSCVFSDIDRRVMAFQFSPHTLLCYSTKMNTTLFWSCEWDSTHNPQILHDRLSELWSARHEIMLLCVALWGHNNIRIVVYLWWRWVRRQLQTIQISSVKPSYENFSQTLAVNIRCYSGCFSHWMNTLHEIWYFRQRSNFRIQLLEVLLSKANIRESRNISSNIESCVCFLLYFCLFWVNLNMIPT
jgi:hypothetical protein